MNVVGALEANRLKMVGHLMELTSAEGIWPTALENVRLGRVNSGVRKSPVLYEPTIYIVANGRKTGYIGDRTFTYDANNYLVLSVPLPFECRTECGPDAPMLGISVGVTPTLVGDLALRMQLRPQTVTVDTVGCVEAVPLDLAMSDAAVRLLDALSRPVDAAILGPGIVREIVYRALCGPQGQLLLAMVGRQGQTAQINAALQWIHERYAEPFNVSRMAGEVGMSVSAFHHQFKAVTASSPVQYVKSIRLHKARGLIVSEGAGAAVAATRVGYESPSQFSREFKRLFGATPGEESRRLRTSAPAAS